MCARALHFVFDEERTSTEACPQIQKILHMQVGEKRIFTAMEDIRTKVASCVGAEYGGWRDFLAWILECLRTHADLELSDVKMSIIYRHHKLPGVGPFFCMKSTELLTSIHAHKDNASSYILRALAQDSTDSERNKSTLKKLLSLINITEAIPGAVCIVLDKDGDAHRLWTTWCYSKEEEDEPTEDATVSFLNTTNTTKRITTFITCCVIAVVVVAYVG